MSFELIALDGLINNEIYSKKVIAHLKEEYFEGNGAKQVYLVIKEFVAKYQALPTKEALGIMLGAKNMPENLFMECGQVVDAIGSFDPQDPKFLYDETESWARERSMYLAIQDCIGIVDGSDKTRDRHAMAEIMQKALAVSFDSSIGHDYFDRAEEQFDYYHDDTEKFPFVSEMMNRVTKGGIKNKTLNVVQMGINVGKTTWLIQMAAEWLLQGKNVVYFTMEVAEEVIRERIDVKLMEIDFDKLHALERQPYLNRVKSLREKTQGQLIIKEFPPGAHVGHFRHTLNEIKLKKGWKVDMACVDYLTIAGSSRLPISAMTNSNLYYTKVSEEVRGLGKEFDIPIWAAAQFNRGGQTKENVTMEDVGLAIGIAATADFMAAFMQPEEMAPMNQIIGKVLKNRYASKHKIGKFIMGSDPDLQSFYDVDMSQQRNVMDANELALATAPLQTKSASTVGFDFSS